MKKEISGDFTEEHYISDLSSINLSQHYPNPFNPSNAKHALHTVINYSLIKGGNTTLKILNIKGQLIKTLVDEYKPKGDYSVIWDGTNNKDKKLSSGVYYYRLQVDNRVKTKSLTLVK